MSVNSGEKFLSIVIPVYNSSKYIYECLDSLLAQDIPDNDYEIIFVDDGSNDGTEKILDDFAQKYCNVMAYHKENKGVSSARNVGLNLSCGRYIWFVDADDFVTPNVLDKLKTIAEKQQPDRIKMESFSFCDDLTLGQVTTIFEKNPLKPNVPYKDVMATRTLYKREYLIKNNIWFLEDVHYGEDGVFNYQTLIHNPQTTESKILTYFYRVHNASATNVAKEKRVKKSLKGSKSVFDVLVDDYNQKICLCQTRRMLIYWMHAIFEHYSVLNYEYFCDNFIWEYKLYNMPLKDFELRRLYKALLNLSKTHNYKKLKKIASNIANKEQHKKDRKAIQKKLMGYIKHPKRLLKIIFKKDISN